MSPADAFHDIGNTDEHHIPHRMAVGVVDPFKIVHVHHDQRVLASLFLQIFRQLLHDKTAVVKSRQLITERSPVQLLHICLERLIQGAEFILLLFVMEMGLDSGSQFLRKERFSDVITGAEGKPPCYVLFAVL